MQDVQSAQQSHSFSLQEHFFHVSIFQFPISGLQLGSLSPEIISHPQ